MAGATTESLIPRGGPHRRIGTPGGGATPQDLIPRGVPHRRIYLVYMFILTIPERGHIGGSDPKGGSHQGIGSPGEGHIAGSDHPGGGGGHTGGSASKSNILANLNLYSKGLQGMNQEVLGRLLIQKTACKKSRVSVPLKEPFEV
jgi:hypothetical protein